MPTIIYKRPEFNLTIDQVNSYIAAIKAWRIKYDTKQKTCHYFLFFFFFFCLKLNKHKFK